jgi:hypothetical protein
MASAARKLSNARNRRRDLTPDVVRGAMRKLDDQRKAGNITTHEHREYQLQLQDMLRDVEQGA